MSIKYCPILFQDGFQKACVKNECAWWQVENEKCAVLLIGEGFMSKPEASLED